LTNRGRRARLEDIQQIADALREPVDSPDLSASILARVDSQRCFLPCRARAMVWIGRGAAAFAVILVVLGITLANTYHPGAMSPSPQPTLVTGVISAVSSQANEQITALRFSLVPSGSTSMDITGLLASVPAVNDLAEPLGAAIHAVSFVGPPIVYSQSECIGDLGIRDLPAGLASRLPRLGQSAWPPEGLREAMEDRRWLEDESPLLSGASGSIVPR